MDMLPDCSRARSRRGHTARFAVDVRDDGLTRGRTAAIASGLAGSFGDHDRIVSDAR